MSPKPPALQGWQDQSHPHPTLCVSPPHPAGATASSSGDDGHGKGFRKMQSQRKDELLACVPRRQNLLLFTSVQKNTQQVEKPIPHRLSAWAWSNKGPEYFTQAPRENHRNKTCVLIPRRAGESREYPAWAGHSCPNPHPGWQVLLGRKPERMEIK